MPSVDVFVVECNQVKCAHLTKFKWCEHPLAEIWKNTHNMFKSNTAIIAYNNFSVEFVWNNVNSLDAQQSFPQDYLRPSLHHHRALHFSKRRAGLRPTRVYVEPSAATPAAAVASQDTLCCKDLLTNIKPVGLNELECEMWTFHAGYAL